MDKSPSDKRRLSRNSDEAIIVGRITGAWGLFGDVKVESSTDFPQRFSPESILFLEGRSTRVVRSRAYKSGFIVKFEKVDDRTHAESLQGTLLAVPSDSAEPLPEGTYYHFQIIDMGVWTDHGAYLGNVAEILTTGSNDVYVVRRGGEKDVLVPALKDVILEIDLAEGRMVVRLPEGLG